MTQLILFDYLQLDIETREKVHAKTDEIKTIARRTVQDTIDIGVRLIEIKQMLPHGAFGGWLDSEFGWSQQTAKRFINVANKFQNQQIVDFDIAPSALYLLAAPSTPPEARADAIEQAQNGKVITHKKAKSIKEKHTLPPQEHTCPSCVKDTGDNELIKGEAYYTPKPRPAPKSNPPHVSQNSGDSEWYTPPEYIEAARQVMGGIDLDPASCETANAEVGATRYFTQEIDGLKQRWAGRVWMNPPYSTKLIKAFCAALSAHYATGSVTEAIALVNNATETEWFKVLSEYATAVCFPRSRVKFWHPDKISAPLQGQAILYLGAFPDDFRLEFKKFGEVWRR